MSANPQSNWLNTIAVRASYIFPILKRFLGENQQKPGRVGYLLPEETKTEISLSFGVLG